MKAGQLEDFALVFANARLREKARAFDKLQVHGEVRQKRSGYVVLRAFDSAKIHGEARVFGINNNVLVDDLERVI